MVLLAHREYTLKFCLISDFCLVFLWLWPEVAIMTGVSPDDFESAVENAVSKLTGISALYPSQKEVLWNLVQQENVFCTVPTNGGKTLPPVLLPSVVLELIKLGYDFPHDPRIIFVTALNSIQLSLTSSMASLGIECAAITTGNIEEVLKSGVGVLFVGPEVLKSEVVIKMLLKFRSSFMCKIVDEAHLGMYYINYMQS